MLFNKINEQELVSRLKADDETAFKLLYDNYWEQLFISAYNLLKKKEICEDILQEIFINIWNNRKNLEIRTSLKGYLHTCVFHKVYDYFRKNKNVFNEEFFENIDSRVQNSNPESKLIYKELVNQINATVELLPEKCQEVYKLSREKQLSHKEIAQHLNTSTKNVEAHITKALKLIKSSIYNISCIELILFAFNDLIH